MKGKKRTYWGKYLILHHMKKVFSKHFKVNFFGSLNVCCFQMVIYKWLSLSLWEVIVKMVEEWQNYFSHVEVFLYGWPYTIVEGCTVCYSCFTSKPFGLKIGNHISSLYVIFTFVLVTENCQEKSLFLQKIWLSFTQWIL